MGPQILYVLFAALASCVARVAALARGGAATPVCLNLGNCTNVDAWGLQVELSKQGQAGQRLCLVPSSVINATYVLGSEVCGNDASNKTCQASHGGTFAPSTLAGFVGTPTTGLDNPAETFWNDLNGPVETFGTVDFGLAGFTELKDYEIGVVTNGSKFNLGQLGIGPSSTLLKALKAQGYIDSLMFGFDAGSQSFARPRSGRLVLGGYDRSRVVGGFVEFDINYEPTEFRPCPFRVEIKTVDLSFEDDRKTAAFIELESRNPVACIEPYDNLFRFPKSRLASLNNSIGLGEGKILSDTLSGLHINEPGWRYANGNSPSPFSLNIALKGKSEDFQIVVPDNELRHPLRGIDSNGKYAVSGNYTELNIFDESAVRNTIVLGKAFLSQVYLAVDYDRGKFYLAESSPEPGGSCDPILFEPEGKSEESEHPTKVAGYVGLALGIAGLVVALFVLLLGVWLWKTGRLVRILRGPGVNMTVRTADQMSYVVENTQNIRDKARQVSLVSPRIGVADIGSTEDDRNNHSQGSIYPSSDRPFRRESS